LRKRRCKVRFAEFEVLLQIGEGGYGQVFLARKRDTKELCALKKMSKARLIKRGKDANILVERDVLSSTRSPWLVKLLYSFQDENNVFFAMEYVPGGDMRSLLNSVGSMREEPAKFYAAEMIMAMVSLHALGFLHRDLKPENYLLDEQGHIKLTDFGLAKGNLSPEWLEDLHRRLEAVKEGSKAVYRSSVEKRSLYRNLKKEDRAMARSFVGTPDYMAPELLTGQVYDLLVDYWAMGCILFEVLYGFTPFTGKTVEEVFLSIMHHQRTLERPADLPDMDEDVSDEAWDLITRLLAPRDRRIGTLAELQAHPWFLGVSWDTLRDENPPFVPCLDSPEDTKYFDKDGFGDPRFHEDGEAGSKTIARKAFIGFTYKHQGWQNTVAKKQVITQVREMTRSQQ